MPSLCKDITTVFYLVTTSWKPSVYVSSSPKAVCNTSHVSETVLPSFRQNFMQTVFHLNQIFKKNLWDMLYLSSLNSCTYVTGITWDGICEGNYCQKYTLLSLSCKKSCCYEEHCYRSILITLIYHLMCCDMCLLWQVGFLPNLLSCWMNAASSIHALEMTAYLRPLQIWWEELFVQLWSRCLNMGWRGQIFLVSSSF